MNLKTYLDELLAGKDVEQDRLKRYRAGVEELREDLADYLYDPGVDVDDPELMADKVIVMVTTFLVAQLVQ